MARPVNSYARAPAHSRPVINAVVRSLNPEEWITFAFSVYRAAWVARTFEPGVTTLMLYLIKKIFRNVVARKEIDRGEFLDASRF